MDVYLRTERLVLRRFTAGDADALVELDSDPDVMFHINGGIATPREEIETDILPAFLAYYDRGDRFGFWAAHDEQAEFIGWFHLRSYGSTPPDEPELGYRLRKQAWGRGYASEGSTALVAKALGEFGVRRVWAETMAVNTASRRVMERAGLRYVRTFHQQWPHRIPGDEQGDVEYELTREQWAATSRD